MLKVLWEHTLKLEKPGCRPIRTVGSSSQGRTLE